MRMKALLGTSIAFIGGLAFSVSLFNLGQAAEAQDSPSLFDVDSQAQAAPSQGKTHDLLSAATEDALQQQKQEIVQEASGNKTSTTAGKGSQTSLQEILDEEKKAQQDALTLGQLAEEVNHERAKMGNVAKDSQNSESVLKENPVVLHSQKKNTPPLHVQTKQERSQTGSVASSVATLEQRNTSLATQLERQTVALENIQGSRKSLEDKIALSDARIRQLSSQLAEAQNRLMIAETEVERLSHALEQKHGTRLLPVRQNVNAEAAPLRGKDDPFFNEPKVSNDMSVATVVSDKANLRAGPGLNNSPIMNISRGTRLAVETRQGSWYRVIAPTGVRAWVSADVVQFGRSEHSKPSRTLHIGGYDAAADADADEKAAFQLLQRRPS